MLRLFPPSFTRTVFHHVCQTSCRCLPAALSVLMVLLPSVPQLQAQAYSPQPGYPAQGDPAQPIAPPDPQQLDQLLAPVALYPDQLLAQITTASTDPQEILDVDNWLANNPGMSGAQLSTAAELEGFDAAFVALVQFPNVIQMMAENIDDFAAIGQAVTANQGMVSDSIQRLRAQAYEAGSLRSNQYQMVQPQQVGGVTYYVIDPANLQTVYVPQYDPTVVYVRPAGGSVAASLISFGVGFSIGALMVNRPWGWAGWGWDWRSHGVYYNHAVWGGWRQPYAPRNAWFRPRPVVWSNRPGYGGNWSYHPANYRAPLPVNRPGTIRPGLGNRPMFSHGAPPSRPTYGTPGVLAGQQGPGQRYGQRSGQGAPPNRSYGNPGAPGNQPAPVHAIPPNRPAYGTPGGIGPANQPGYEHAAPQNRPSPNGQQPQQRRPGTPPQPGHQQPRPNGAQGGKQQQQRPAQQNQRDNRDRHPDQKDDNPR